MSNPLKQGIHWLFRRGRFDAEVDREMQFHLDKEIEQRVAAGMSPADARRTAMRDFGGVGRTREEVRDVRGMTFWESLSQDIRFGVRTLGRTPGYTLAAVFTLALGIGANAAMFSVIDGVLIKPLPFRDGQQLVLVEESALKSNRPAINVSISELFAYRQRVTTIQSLVEHHSMNFILLDQGEPDRVDTGVVSANFFDVLGVKPIYGRTFVAADDRLGADAVLVLSNEYWQKKFGGDPKVVGRVLQMNDRPHTIVGVLPAFPQYPRNEDVYMSTSACPYRSAAEKALPGGGFRSFGALTVFGRLAPGATVAQASAELSSIAASFEREHGKDYARLQGLNSRADMLGETLVVGARPMLYALSGVTLLVLLITCANVANLSVARTVRRTREFAVRSALGAGRTRLARQLLTESLIVAVAGGMCGLGLAGLSIDLLVSFVGRFTARTSDIGLNGSVLAFTLGVSVVTGVIFGVAPALAARRNHAQSMRDGAAQGGEGTSKQRLRASLVAAQVAVSFVLLVGAALLLQSFHKLASVAMGFDTDHVMTATMASGRFLVNPTDAERIDADRKNQAILDRLRSSPGIRAAALTSAVPLTQINPFPQAIEIEGRANTGARSFDADINVASDGYFDTLQIPILAGREFKPSDTTDAPHVAVINASMAKFWNGVDPIGSRIRTAGSTREEDWNTVVGVVADYRLYGGDRDVLAEAYIPMRQNGGGSGGRIIARSEGDPGTLVQTIKDAVHAIAPTTAVKDLKTLSELKDGRLAAPRLTATLLTVFAVVALVITLAGITGVIATSVSQRTREFGLRVALGASRSSVLRLVLGQALVLIAVGLAAGIVGAFAFSQTLQSFLFKTETTDLTTYLAVGAVFAAAGALACLVPARRATSIDPLTALRTE